MTGGWNGSLREVFKPRWCAEFRCVATFTLFQRQAFLSKDYPRELQQPLIASAKCSSRPAGVLLSSSQSYSRSKGDVTLMGIHATG